MNKMYPFLIYYYKINDLSSKSRYTFTCVICVKTLFIGKEMVHNQKYFIINKISSLTEIKLIYPSITNKKVKIKSD